MTSLLTMTEHRPAGWLGRYVRAFQVFSTTDLAGASVLDFGAGDVSVPLCFGDPVLVEDWGGAEVPSAAVVGPRRRAVWLRFGAATDQVPQPVKPPELSCEVGEAVRRHDGLARARRSCGRNLFGRSERKHSAAAGCSRGRSVCAVVGPVADAPVPRRT